MSRNIFSENQINIRELNAVVEYCARHKKSLLIYGGPGLGKSQKIQQLADKLFGVRKPGELPNVVDFRLADKEPSDVVGHQIPTEVDGKMRTVYALPDFWPDDPDWKGFVFLDELLNAEPYLQNVAFQIMLDRRIGNYRFPEGAILVGAGNRDGDGGATHALIPALANRMVLVELYYDTKVFLEDFAIPMGLHPAIISMLKTESHMIENYETQCLKGGSPSFTTPRTLADSSDVLYDLDAGLISERLASVLLQGLVGKITADALKVYRSELVLPPIDKILDGTLKDAGPDITEDRLYLIGVEGVNRIKREILGDELTDEEIVERTQNFLLYLHDNFSERNADFVTSVFLSFTKGAPSGGPVLQMNSRREKLIPKLINKYPVAMEVIRKYVEDYAEAVKILNSNKK